VVEPEVEIGIRRAVVDARGRERVQVTVEPAERRLDDVMQPIQRDVGRDHDAPPDRWAPDADQADLQPRDRMPRAGLAGVAVTDAATRRMESLEVERARAEATIALSLAHDAELHVDGLGGELRPFQRAAVRYALTQRRTLLADEQGLGKTIEALAALQADRAFPAAVVCPASMKLVWQRECERWLPERRVAVLHGRGADGWLGSGPRSSTSRTTARTRGATARRLRSRSASASPATACGSR